MTTRVNSLLFDEKDILGQGSFAIVFSGIRRYVLESTRYYNCTARTPFFELPVAVKRLQKVAYTSDTTRNILQEVELMQKAGDHPNILTYIFTEENDHFLYVFI